MAKKQSSRQQLAAAQIYIEVLNALKAKNRQSPLGAHRKAVRVFLDEIQFGSGARLEHFIGTLGIKADLNKNNRARRVLNSLSKIHQTLESFTAQGTPIPNNMMRTVIDYLEFWKAFSLSEKKLYDVYRAFGKSDAAKRLREHASQD